MRSWILILIALTSHIPSLCEINSCSIVQSLFEKGSDGWTSSLGSILPEEGCLQLSSEHIDVNSSRSAYYIAPVPYTL